MDKEHVIAVACDHGGFQLKQAVMAHLKAAGLAYKDFGTYTPESCDYPDFAVPACDAIVSGKCDRGILICGTGIGMSICANKIDGIRAAACTEAFSAEFTRRHNDANVLCLGQRVLGEEKAMGLIDLFLKTPYEGGRHARRLEKIAALEKR